MWVRDLLASQAKIAIQLLGSYTPFQKNVSLSLAYGRFLGGVNWALLVAFVCKLCPNCETATILHKFFWWMKEWSWPRPLRINNIVDAGMGLKIWDPIKNKSDVMPILTPAYPAFNSSFSVSLATLAIMKAEFERAFNICNQVHTNSTENI